MEWQDILNEGMWNIWTGKEEIYLKLIFWNYLQGLKEATGIFSQDSLSLGREGNPVPQG